MNEKFFSQFIDSVYNQKDGQIQIHNLLVKTRDKTFFHSFTDPNQARDVRSISKTVLTVALGLVMRLADEGKYPRITENTYIYPILEDAISITRTDNLSKLKKVQIKHLLTHTIGYGDVLLMRGDIEGKDPYSLLNYTLNYPIIYEPGEHYLYSNAGFYLLSAVLEHFLKEDLTAFLSRELFQPLGISSFTWEKYGDYVAGATRLWLKPRDLLAFGELLLRDGEIKGRQIISKNWLRKMTRKHIRTKDVDTAGAIFRRYAYGYGLWLPKKDSFFFGHGTDGQILVILPEMEAIIVTQAEQPDIKPIENIVNELVLSLYQMGN